MSRKPTSLTQQPALSKDRIAGETAGLASSPVEPVRKPAGARILENRLRLDRRLSGRRGITLCDVLIEGEVVPHRVSVTNLTDAGLQIRTPISCQVGSRLKVYLPESEQPNVASGVICYSCRIKDESGTRFAYGVEFDLPGTEKIGR